MIWMEGFAGWVYFEEASYVEFPEPEELVFHQVNGETKVNKDFIVTFREFIVTFRVPGNQFGWWRCSIYRGGDGYYYLKLEWVPKSGYSWEEVMIYRLKKL